MPAIIRKNYIPFVPDHVKVLPRRDAPPPAFARGFQKPAGYAYVNVHLAAHGIASADVVRNSKVHAKLMSFVLHAMDVEEGMGFNVPHPAAFRSSLVERYVADGKRHVLAGSTLNPQERVLLVRLYAQKCAPGSGFLEGTASQVRQRVLDELKQDPVGSRLAAGQFGVAERSFKSALQKLQKSTDPNMSQVQRAHGQPRRVVTEESMNRLMDRNEEARSTALGTEARALVREISAYAKHVSATSNAG